MSVMWSMLPFIICSFSLPLSGYWAHHRAQGTRNMAGLRALRICALYLSFSASYVSAINRDMASFFTGSVVPGEVVTGSVNGSLTLPCTFTGSIRWVRGKCSSSASNEIIKIDNERVSWRKSARYQLLGDISQEDVSLTITGVTREDEGTYCCRKISEIESIFAKNEEKELEVKIHEGEVVTGLVNGRLTLPCTFTGSIHWVQGKCSSSASNEIIKIDNEIVTWRKSTRYQLLGDISQGDVSLTITGVTTEDQGTYCCREIDSFFGVLQEKELEVKLRDVITGLVNGRLTLPCTFTGSIRWVRGKCSASNEIIKIDNEIVTWRKSARYQLLGDISQGDVSLTITGVTREDEGTYCCRGKIDSLFARPQEKELEVKIREGPEVTTVTAVRPKTTQPIIPKTTQPIIPKTTQPITPKTTTDSSTTEVMVATNSLDVGGRKTASIGNIIRGILILLLPPLFILIFKYCSFQS